MKMISWSRSRPLNRAEAWVCVVTNQLVTPGLGSIVAGRLWPGLIQLALAVAGCVLIVIWFFHLLQAMLQNPDPTAGLRLDARTGELGLALFLAGWLLALFSSIGILRKTRRIEKGNVPPRI